MAIRRPVPLARRQFTGAFSVQRETLQSGDPAAPAHLPAPAIYLIAFVTGAIVMSFEMLGSRYLNPYFGSGIYTWASLISTVLGALTVGYFIGGWLADRVPSVVVLGVTVLIGSLYMLILPTFAQPMLEWLLAGVDDIRTGSLLASVAILFFPVTFFGMYSPFAIRLMLRSAERSGTISGAVYGISTIGSIAGTLGTTFFLLPSMGSRTLTLTLGCIGMAAALVLIALPALARRPATVAALAAAMIAFAAPLAPAQNVAQDLVDEQARAALLKRPDGRIARIETEYNDIFITKRRNELTMSFQLKGWDYTESVTNLRDPDDLPVHYTRAMTTALAYPETPNRILMIGLGGGSISTYLGRAMPDVTIDTVEIDPGVINAARRYFGVKDNARVKYLAGDGRVFLNRNKQLYDLILIDAYHGGYVPFHLLTREFYTLVKQRLAPGGAAAFNVHDGTKLYVSTIKTLQEVFASVHLYPTGEGEVIMVATAQAAPPDDTLKERAAALQQRHNFRYALPQLLTYRIAQPDLGKAELLTDDFAPVNLYDSIGREQRKKK
jgi:spermidine synthase